MRLHLASPHPTPESVPEKWIRLAHEQLAQARRGGDLRAICAAEDTLRECEQAAAQVREAQ